MTGEARRGAEDHVRTLAASGLPSDRTPPERPLLPTAWSELLGRVRNERLEGVLADAVGSGWWPATDDQRQEAAEAHRRAMALALTLDRLLVQLAERFDAAGLRWRAIKGPAVAHLDHADPALRCYGDLDVLVAGQDVPAALAILAERGGRRRYRSPSSRFDRHYGKGAAVALPDHLEVDVHRTLALGPYGLALDPEDLLDLAPERFTVGGRSLPALPRPARFLHACYHAALGTDPPRLAPLRDVALLLPPEDEARQALALARAWRGEAVVARGLALAVGSLGWRSPDPLVRWGRALVPSARDDRWLAAYAGPRRSSRGRTALALEALPDLRTRVAYAGSLLPGYLRGTRRARTPRPG